MSGDFGVGELKGWRLGVKSPHALMRPYSKKVNSTLLVSKCQFSFREEQEIVVCSFSTLLKRLKPRFLSQ